MKVSMSIRYPALVRVEGTPDYLDDITTPLTRPDPASLSPSRPQSN